MRKYELIKTEKAKKYSKEHNTELFQVRALKDFVAETPYERVQVYEGDLGGFIENECNLSQTDNCWLLDRCFILNNATLRENACLLTLKDDWGWVVLQDNAIVEGNATIWSNTVLSEHCIIKDEVYLSANGGMHVGGNAVISGYLKIEVQQGDLEINIT